MLVAVLAEVVLELTASWAVLALLAWILSALLAATWKLSQSEHNQSVSSPLITWTGDTGLS